ncbi:MAG: hypothetical protein PHY12_05745 [Eubacteriales bacterium]|nr:hypothetical protein [Eubacteriales bacterium]
MICKWLDEDTEVCCNDQCPARADFCPMESHMDDCEFAEEKEK